jgi:hypothetical protein
MKHQALLQAQVWSSLLFLTSWSSLEGSPLLSLRPDTSLHRPLVPAQSLQSR